MDYLLNPITTWLSIYFQSFQDKFLPHSKFPLLFELGSTHDDDLVDEGLLFLGIGGLLEFDSGKLELIYVV